MHLLILGGGVFLGSATLTSALARGHSVTVFNRGRSRTAWPAGVEVLTGDRTGDLTVLATRRWDAVIDTCGYVPTEVRASAEALVAVDRYLFISSISAYATTSQVPVTESDRVAENDAIARDDHDMKFYGPQKAACEREVRAVFGGRAVIVRPGLIVGPSDPTGRFSHWPWRSTAGGALLVPAAPASAPLQFIDVRDLADWLVHLLEARANGIFNATGPVGGLPIHWAGLLAACGAEVSRRGGEPARPVSVAEDFLSEHGVMPWSELPLWLPSADPEYAGFFRVDIERAAAAGLTTRALGETVGAVLDEGLPAQGDSRRRGKLTREKEQRLLAMWASR